MKIQNTILTQLKTLSLRGGNLQHRPFLYPLREWAVCLTLTVIVAITLFGYAALDFNTQLTEKNMPVIPEEQMVRYRSSDADGILRYYEGRTRIFNTLRQDVPYIPEVITVAEPEPVAVPVDVAS